MSLFNNLTDSSPLRQFIKGSLSICMPPTGPEPSLNSTTIGFLNPGAVKVIVMQRYWQKKKDDTIMFIVVPLILPILPA